MSLFKICLTGLLLSQVSLASCQKGLSGDAGQIAIPAAGNSWVTTNLSLNEDIIGENGIKAWSDGSTVIRTWFKTERPGLINLALRTRNLSGTSVIEVKVAGKILKATISGRNFDTLRIGTFNLNSPGYQSVAIRGIEKSGSTFGDISDFLISGPVTEGRVWFIKDDFYFGRRGPSVHLRYDLSGVNGDIEWFYNEITVPEGNDVIGSYFMANGFADGYFGIQVNSDTERRILFSVWSPYKTDNPGEIPDEYKIILLDKGEGVITKEFGNEGSGGQSYRVFPWKAGSTYRFLLRGHPSENNSTDYAAWFFAPEIGKWEMIASFRRPKTNNYLKNLYSFVENFMPEKGILKRQGLFSNQWVKTADGRWHELTSAKFTADATARKEARLDYSGGIVKGAFFLKNCGFFNEMTRIDTVLVRPPASNPALPDTGKF